MNRLVWLAAVFAGLGGFLFGYDVGIISGALLQLDERFMLTDVQKEYVVSLMLVGALLASVTGGWIVDKFSRRNTIIGNSGIFVIGAIILAAAPNVPVLLLGRVVVGFGVSLSAISEIIYISEISPPKQRGMLVSVNEIGITFGIFCAYLVNYIFISTPNGWRIMFGLSIVPAVVQSIGMVFLPKSPRWLLLHKKYAKARHALALLRTNHGARRRDRVENAYHEESNGSTRRDSAQDASVEQESMVVDARIALQEDGGEHSDSVGNDTASLSESASLPTGHGTHTAQDIYERGPDCVREVEAPPAASELTLELQSMEDSIRNQRSQPILTLISNAMLRKCLVIGCSLTLLQQFTGQPNVLYYGSTVLKAVGFDSDKEATLANLAVGFVKVVATVVSVVRVDKAGRRRLLLLGTAVMMASLLLLATMTAIYPPIEVPEGGPTGNSTMSPSSMDTRLEFTNASVKWMSLICLIVFVIAYAFSFGPVVWLILAEIFPDNIRGRAVGLATIFNWGGNLVVSLTFLSLIDSITFSGTFFLYASVCCLALGFIYGNVPETKGRTLEEISQLMASPGYGCLSTPKSRMAMAMAMPLNTHAAIIDAQAAESELGSGLEDDEDSADLHDDMRSLIGTDEPS